MWKKMLLHDMVVGREMKRLQAMRVRVKKELVLGAEHIRTNRYKLLICSWVEALQSSAIQLVQTSLYLYITLYTCLHSAVTFYSDIEFEAGYGNGVRPSLCSPSVVAWTSFPCAVIPLPCFLCQVWDAVETGFHRVYWVPSGFVMALLAISVPSGPIIPSSSGFGGWFWLEEIRIGNCGKLGKCWVESAKSFDLMVLGVPERLLEYVPPLAQWGVGDQHVEVGLWKRTSH